MHMLRLFSLFFLVLGMSVRAAGPVPQGMVLIAGGKFKMGDQHDSMPNALPVRDVRVDAFFIDKTEIPGPLWESVRQWGSANGYVFDNARGGQFKQGTNDQGNPHPAQSITWYDAVKWCNARSEKEGLKPCYYIDFARTLAYKGGQPDIANGMVDWNANGYRLPTEAEWEKAARGGRDGLRFPWGNNELDGPKNTNFQRTGNPYMFGNQPWTAPVGSFQPIISSIRPT